MGNNKIITPYHGNKPYIFVSYSHRNMDDAMEIVNQLQSNCYRVWYDEGIDPGSEWDENIASHVENCGFFIALLSQEYLSSSNCKDELNYARDLEKPRLLIYLDDIQLPGGMQMRLSRLQAIHKYRYDDKESFYEKLFVSKGIDTCLEVNDLEDANDIIQETYELNNPDASLRLICVLDTSGSMAGERIGCLNEGLKRVQSSLLKKYGSELAVDILQYDTSPQWRTFSELPIKASGTTNVGEALKALREYGNRLPDNCSCALVFSSDGWPTDLYGDIQQLLQQEKWFYTAVKIGIAISEDASTEMLTNVIGSQNAVVTVEKVHLLSELFETLAVASVKAAKKNGEQRTHIEGRDIVDWLDNENIDEEIKWNLEEDGVLVIMSGAIIPDFYRPNPKTPWANHRNAIRKVVLRQGVRIVGMHAFYDLPNLEEVRIPQSVTNIRAGAFGNCPNLRTVTLSRKIAEISDYRQKAAVPADCVVLWPEAFANTPWNDENDCNWNAGTDFAY